MANIEIGGRLHSTATGNVVTGANEVLDDTKNKKQSVINAEVDEAIGDDNTAGTIKGRIKTTEGKLDTLNGDSSTSGSVAKAVADAKTELIDGATSNGNTLKKVEDRTATLETAVGSNGSVDQRIAAAKSEVIGDAASDYNTLGKLEDKIQAEASARESAVSTEAQARQDAITAETNRATTRENQIYDLVHTPEQHYVTVATYAELTSIASPSDDTVYRVSSYNGKTSQVDNTVYSEYGYNGTNFVFLCVKSQIDEVYDISAHHSNNTYVDLAAALDGGNNIPQELRRGGMSVKFVQSSDNKYIQARCMAQNFTTDVTQWQNMGDFVEEKEHPIADNEVAGYLTDKNKSVIAKLMKSGAVEWLVENSKDIANNTRFESIEDLLSYVSSEVPDSGNGIIKYLTDKDGKVIVTINNVGDTEFKGGGGFNGEITKTRKVYFNAVKILTDINNHIIGFLDYDGKVILYGNLEVPNVLANYITLSKKGINQLKENLGLIDEYGGSIKDVLEKSGNSPIYHPLDENGKELPTELCVHNVDRKACQYRYIEWDALSPIPKNSASGGYYTGHQIGLPYSSCWEVDKIVGYDITFTTFMTAANNPYSMLYTENLRDNGSVYGFTYHAGRGTIAGWSGIVCNIMETFATGMKIPYNTGMWAYLESIGKLIKVYEQSAQGVRIGDFLWQSGHGRMVQTIWRKNYGIVDKIDVCSGGRSSSEYMFETPEAFDTDLRSRNGIIYRNTDLFKNTEYKQLPFITLEGETPIPFTYNNDICTYAGDYATFREGFRIVLNYNLKEDKEWQNVELYKNDVLFGTYNLSDDIGVYNRGPENYPAEKAALVPSHSFDLSFLNLTYGKYKARLVNSSNEHSDYTYFEILNTNVSYSKDEDGLTEIHFFSNNGIPQYIRWSEVNGGAKGLYALNKDDIDVGFCKVDVVELIKKQYNNLSDNDTYLKVYFEGEYGCVTNEPILFNI